MEKSKRQNFIQGAGILFLAMVVVKLIGAVFKIPLANVLLESGMAYFNASYNLFIMIYALTVTGLTTAVARMVAACAAKGQYRECRSILRVSKKLFLALGLAGTIVMLLCAKLFAGAAKVPESVYAIAAMTPAIFFSCLMATYRGYYEGLLNMIPSAVSQVVEVVFKLVFGLGFTYLVLWAGQRSYAQEGTVFGLAVEVGETAEQTQANVLSCILPFAAAGAMLGVTVSTFTGFLYLYRKFRRGGTDFTKEELAASPSPAVGRKIVLILLKSALPITLSAVVANLTNMIDLFSIMNRLDFAYQQNSAYFEQTYGTFLSGRSIDMATYLFGGYTMAQTVFNLVPSFTALLGKSALPNITLAWINRNKRILQTNVESVVRMTTLIAFPAGIGIAVLAKPIAQLLYAGADEAALSVGLPLRTLGIAAIFVSMITPLYAILQAMGRFDLPVKFIAVGGVLKLAVNFVLVGIPEINVSGAAVGTALCYGTILMLCLHALKKITGMGFHFGRIFGKNLAAALFCGAAAWLVNMRLGDGTAATLAAVCAAGIAYVMALLVLRVFTRADLEMIPHAQKLTQTLEKLHLLEKT